MADLDPIAAATQLALAETYRDDAEAGAGRPQPNNWGDLFSTVHGRRSERRKVYCRSMNSRSSSSVYSSKSRP